MRSVFAGGCGLAHCLLVGCAVGLGSVIGLLSAGPAMAASPSLLVQNLLAQQGLAMGLLQTMVWAEIDIGFGQKKSVLGQCIRLPQGGDGSQKTLVRTNGGNNYTVELYYDNACANRYVHAVVAVTGANENTIRFTETLTYYRPNGTKLGTTRLKQRIGNSPQGADFSQMSEVGTFTPVDDGLPVQFGLDCSEPAGEPASAVIHCDVGVAQSVPMLDKDVASVTPVNGTLTQISGPAYSGEFSAKNSKLVRGSNLDISAPTTHSLAITGTSVNVGTSTTNGSVGLLSPFLGAPTHWTVRDAAHNAKLTITLHDGTTPSFAGSITRLDTSAKVATVKLDIAGNGFVLFSNNKKVKVSNWMMVN